MRSRFGYHLACAYVAVFGEIIRNYREVDIFFTPAGEEDLERLDDELARVFAQEKILDIIQICL